MQPSGLLGHVFRGRPQRPGYERAKITLVTGRPHALRPSGIVDGQRRRLTLCGLLASATPGRFEAMEARACKTCARVASIRPPGRPVQVSEELAALRSVIDALGVELSRRLLAQQQSGSRPTEADRIFTELVLAT
jgi:hypothetical protein